MLWIWNLSVKVNLLKYIKSPIGLNKINCLLSKSSKSKINKSNSKCWNNLKSSKICLIVPIWSKFTSNISSHKTISTSSNNTAKKEHSLPIKPKNWDKSSHKNKYTRCSTNSATDLSSCWKPESSIKISNLPIYSKKDLTLN